jgi:aerobic-type carbon monoxide dehydrogenase small subunit (CoxS/CutS family)
VSLALEFELNGRPCRTSVPAHFTVLDLVRDGLALFGTKDGCGEGVCGACTVLLDGEPVRGCIVLAARVAGRAVVTIEGVGGEGPDPLQEAFAMHGAAQCGFCTPGMILTARALLDRNPDPSDEEIRVAISGQICRCTGYATIVRAVRWAAEHPDM